jgi:putative membrane protein
LVTKLSSDERRALQAACEAAEKRTSARLVVVTVPISDRYALYPLVYGGIAAVAVFGALALFWHHLPLREAFFLTAMIAAAVTFALDVMPLRLMAVPRRAKNWECWELAHRAFASRVLARNDRKTGIVLFVSFGERYIEVVTDRDVDLHIPQTVWDAIIKDFLVAAKKGRVGEGLPAAVEACAKVLEQHYPAE